MKNSAKIFIKKGEQKSRMFENTSVAFKPSLKKCFLDLIIISLSHIIKVYPEFMVWTL